MILSMTAFARSQQTAEHGELIWELRSLNHRYLDLSLRLPEVLRSGEPAFRQRLANKIKRGKVEATLRFRPVASTSTRQAKLDRNLATYLTEQLSELERIGGGLSGWNVDAVQMLQWPGLLEQPSPDTETLTEQASTLLDQAIEALISVRCGEGAQLADMIRQRLDDLEAEVLAIRDKMPEIAQTQRQRMHERMQDALEQIDSQRLEQEIALLLQKMDVAEEIDRLQAHVRETRQVLTRKEPVGRRLDFLMQEFNREANTLGSKSVHPATTAAAVEMKVLIEQMREQVQNIE